MKRMLSLVISGVLMVLMAAMPLKAFADYASGTGYYLETTRSILAHESSGKFSVTLTIPANTIGSAELRLTSSTDLTIFGQHLNNAFILGYYAETVHNVDRNSSLSFSYTMLNSAHWSQYINWTVDTYFNGVQNQYSGSFTIYVEHDFSTWVFDTNTSKGAGRHIKSCSVCGFQDGSQWEACSFTSVVTPPTCTEGGVTTYTCSVCGYSYRDITASATGHAWGDWTHDPANSGSASTHSHVCLHDPAHKETQACAFSSAVTPPTCTEDGFTTFTCAECGYSYQGDPVARTGHNWSDWSHDDSTAGTTSRHKRVCGNDPAHTESEACAFSSAVTPPTCMEDGFTTFTCTECDYSYQGDPVARTGHNWGAWSHDASTAGTTSQHKRTCGNDPAHTESEACAFSSAVTPPTCTEDGFTTFTCTVPSCGYSYTDAPVKALGHTEVIDPAVPATCTETSLTAGKHCSVCKEVLIPQQVIPALGHLPGEWEVTVPPTNRKTGLQVLRCLRCGELLETMEIPVLSMIWPDNTACSFGPRFRDELPELTDKWYMYTPLDLTKEGTLDVPLIASNRYRIGTAQVTVKDGQVSANYQVSADKVQVKEEFMTFLPGLEGLGSVEPEALADSAVPFGTPVDIASLGESGQALFFMRLVVTYDIYADGVEWWSMP